METLGEKPRFCPRQCGCSHQSAKVGLAVGGAVRLVRPAIAREGAAEVIVLDAWLGEAPQPREMDDALAALSVAAGMSVREAGLLAHDEIAIRYLAARGWSAEAS